ncbi:unnamed protein product [Rhizoctonia solani]|uniref:Uncharacterized protein n=1 Tax=Rhizoctonia solani TaxID=456999 RepID=A0A8H3CQN7_9AGAM|nr:unnamed protein product [Rhizoctonia solani]
MKRRHESTVDSVPRPQSEGTENVPRQILKKRRTINNDNWGRLGRRRSLRDINNLSEHPASVPYDEKTTSKTTQTKHRGSPINSVKEIVPTPNISSPESNTPLHGPRTEHLSTSINSCPPSVSDPSQQTYASVPVPTRGPDVSKSAPIASLPGFASHDKPVRITQSQTSQQIRPSNPRLSVDSDQEDEDSDSDEESEDDGPGPGTERVDSDEKQRVESNYSEINKLLGNLFLSRHRNRT